MKKPILLSLFILKFAASFSQAKSDSLLNAGNIFYGKKEYSKAATIWVQAAEAADNKISKSNIYYYAASVYAAAKDSSNSFKYIELAVNKYGYNDIPGLTGDDDFDFMRSGIRWKKLLASIKPAYSNDPQKVKIVDSDVKNFWIAFDKANADTAHADSIYKKYYFNKGTTALLDYYVNKMGNNIYSFALDHKEMKKFYASIRPDTYKALAYKNEYIKNNVTLKKLYPEAIFPDIYFVIGKLNSAGTSTGNGLIMAIDQSCKTNTTDLSEIKSWQLHYLNPLQALVPIVAHELIHFQQHSMGSDTIMLREAIIEGMADFLGEVISGRTTNERLKTFANGKEKMIWAEFKKDMYLNRKQNWIGNGDQDTPDRPADLGYWVGYRICKSYYLHSKNKKQAVYDMFHIGDYKKFLADSGFDAEISAL
ncbi:DUF2268 domain-containing protein [Mucilaginibacter sp. BJC16-A38]|uniref:DUF2268 domain-containing protein n=1 Tax=Mucilaginibacter phenanthrenivorans TaxID=1234842 RepID=UPI00215746AC|nr:DUF2268 domain-containing protein [Mucilaginibacter phenanthrenivorans]MCR8559021.1 DUF2268 domain-containing protein [Mucilaginibacter phenanthrenivorans]